MDESKAVVLSAVFTMTNFGYAMPEVTDVAPLVKMARDGLLADPTHAVNLLAGGYMESDEHEIFFAEEAARWFELKDWSDERLKETFPDHSALYDAALASVS